MPYAYPYDPSMTMPGDAVEGDSVPSRSFRSRDIEEVQAFYADQAGLRASVNPSAGPVAIDFVAHWMRVGPLQVLEHTRVPALVLHDHSFPSYGIGVAAVGGFLLEQGRTRVVTGPTRAVVHRPDAGPFLTQAGVPSLVRLLAIDRPALEAHLESMLDHPVRGPIRVAPTLELGGPGRTWLELFRIFVDALHDRDSLISRPIVAAPLIEALMSGLLLIIDHDHRDALDHPAARCHPRYVKRALEVIHADPGYPHTAATLARLSGVSVRTLQEAFRRHVGTSPMSYVRRVRLARVHEDLREGRAATVADAAHRWGFLHLGRFAAAYQTRYGVSPSSTRCGAVLPRR